MPVLLSVPEIKTLGNPERLCVADGEMLGDRDALLHLVTDTVALGVRDTLPHGLSVGE